MIHAKDLMIGDYLNTSFGIAKIISIDKVGITFKNKDGEFDIDFHDEDAWIQEILLTPEVLEKNEFIEDSTNGLHSTYHLLVPAGIEKNIYTVQVTFYKESICGVSTLFKCWGPHNAGVDDIHLCNLHYVHEMQHIFRLCGIEKEIEL